VFERMTGTGDGVQVIARYPGRLEIGDQRRAAGFIRKQEKKSS
jgi:hypothetical protein